MCSEKGASSGGGHSPIGGEGQAIETECSVDGTIALVETSGELEFVSRFAVNGLGVANSN
jgi:hypothetical protein